MASATNKSTSNYSLINAIDNDDIDAADALLEQQRFDINERDDEGYTPLLLCCFYAAKSLSRRETYIKLCRKIRTVDGSDVNLCDS